MNSDRLDQALDVAANIRDVGGLATHDGSVVRSGVLYRSAALFSRLDLPAHLRNLSFHTHIDLRANHEFGAEIEWDHGATRHRIPLLDSAAPAELRGSLAGLYTDAVTRGGPQIVRALEIVSDQPGPTLIHCSLGKDRTGIVVAALLLSIGVTADEVIRDYLRSETGAHRVLERLTARGYRTKRELDPAMLRAPAAAIEALIHQFEDRPGGVTGYLDENGIAPTTLGNLRRLLLVPDASHCRC